MNFKFFSALALLSIVAAQSDLTTPTPSGTDTATVPEPSGGGGAGPTGAPGPAIPTCVQTCITQSGCDPTDVTCLCVTNIDTLTSCVTSGCSPDDQTAAASLEAALCASVGGGSSGAMDSTMITGSATTQDTNSTSLTAPASSSAPPSLSLTRTTPSASLTPRPLTSNTPSSTSTTSAAATSTNAAAPQNRVAQGVWVVAAGLVGLAVAA